MKSFTVALLATVSAPASSAPMPAAGEEQLSKRGMGDTSNGSIFKFGSASQCRESFWTSGACGLSTYFGDKVDSNMPLVAMPSTIFDQHGQAQNNKLCGKVITMTHNGVTRKAVVADENEGNEQTIDMCLDDWQAFGGRDNDGTHVKGIQWSIK